MLNWGKSIVLAFVLFGAFIATLVTVCVRQDVSLVSKDYYQQELVYQQQIDRLNHAATLETPPTINIEDGILSINLPTNEIEGGTLVLFRPSDSREDKAFALKEGKQPVQYFSTEGMQRGMYRAKLTWKMEGKEYFVEQIVNL